jgi:stearoyl-CoA desaturase (delta-9 desaturase)
MAFIERILQQPSYGWKDKEGALVKPTSRQLVSELFSRVNIFASRKNWIAAIGWVWVLCLLPFMVLFFTSYFNWWLLPLMLVWGMIPMSTHGTIWYHRYATHRAYTFTNKFWRFITANLMVKVIPEEIYVVSHHVHHSLSDKPGDPYNAAGGFLYCYLADTNHQPIAKDLSEAEYKQVCKLLSHTGAKLNTYAQYKRWGSATHVGGLLLHWLCNWAFWGTVYYLIGGPSLLCALFGGALLWALTVRTFNYQGHGGGEDKRKDGVDYNRKDLSINHSRPGYLGGEWHNNHHLYPTSARAGFLPHQLDGAWIYIYLLHKIGGIKTLFDAKPLFLRDHYRPGLEEKGK